MVELKNVSLKSLLITKNLPDTLDGLISDVVLIETRDIEMILTCKLIVQYKI